MNGTYRIERVRVVGGAGCGDSGAGEQEAMRTRRRGRRDEDEKEGDEGGETEREPGGEGGT